jgi:hypothetical protein
VLSNFSEPTIRPDTGKIEDADWLDDYFGSCTYGVRFKDGKVFTEEEVKLAKIKQRQRRKNLAEFS